MYTNKNVKFIDVFNMYQLSIDIIENVTSKRNKILDSEGNKLSNRVRSE